MIDKIKSKLDYNLELLKNKKIIIWGCLEGGKETFKLLKYFEIDVYAFCDGNSRLHNSKVENIDVIPPANLLDENFNNDLLVIISTVQYQNEIENQLKEMAIDSYITFFDILINLGYKKLSHLKKNNPYLEYIKERFNESDFDNYFIDNYGVNDLLYICTPPKTANTTVINTLIKYNIPYCKMFNRSNKFNKKIIYNSQKTIKVITAVREPIQQKLSMFYHLIGSTAITNVFPSMYNVYGDNIPSDGLDIQLIFDQWIKTNTTCYDYSKTYDFYNNFSENIIDITKYPFNKDEGYTIIKEGNLEVFVYQVEKLNNLINELSKFVGGNFTELVHSNISEDKWFADSYKQAKKEIKITQDYFNECFNDKLIKHCYSEEDIKKFKNKWNDNIQN